MMLNCQDIECCTFSLKLFSLSKLKLISLKKMHQHSEKCLCLVMGQKDKSTSFHEQPKFAIQTKSEFRYMHVSEVLGLLLGGKGRQYGQVYRFIFMRTYFLISYTYRYCKLCACVCVCVCVCVCGILTASVVHCQILSSLYPIISVTQVH